MKVIRAGEQEQQQQPFFLMYFFLSSLFLGQKQLYGQQETYYRKEGIVAKLCGLIGYTTVIYDSHLLFFFVFFS